MRESVRRIVLPNGLRVLLIPRRDDVSVWVEIKLDVGSRHDPLGLGGLAHFSEHMITRGTRRRPTEAVINAETDAVGADFDAGTSVEETSFSLHLSARHLPLALDLLSDTLLRGLIRARDVEIERGAILEEIHGDADEPAEAVGDHLLSLVYPGMGLGRPICGTDETVSFIGRRQILEFRARHYAPSRAALIVAGGFDEARALSLIERSFGSWRSEVVGLPPLEPLSTPSSGPAIVLEQDSGCSQSEVAIGFRTGGYGYSRRFARSILDAILGGLSSSRLWLAVRSDNGLAYHVSSDVEPHRGAGMLSVAAGLNNERLLEAFGLIVQELRRLKRHGITVEELTRAKGYICGQVARHSVHPDFLADYYGAQELFSKKRRLVSLDEYFRSIELVTVAEVNACAREILRASNFHAAILGPVTSVDPFLDLAAKLGE